MLGRFGPGSAAALTLPFGRRCVSCDTRNGLEIFRALLGERRVAKVEKLLFGIHGLCVETTISEK